MLHEVVGSHRVVVGREVLDVLVALLGEVRPAQLHMLRKDLQNLLLKMLARSHLLVLLVALINY